MTLDPRKVTEELARRHASLIKAREHTKDIRAELFDRQLNFIDDPSRNKAAICTRRAGKTMMWPRYCLITALEKPGSLIRIWGITRLRTKQLLWQEILNAAARHRIPNKAHETELTIRFDNGSEIRLVGADKDQSAQRKRGDKTTLEIILESQLFGPFLRVLVEDVAEPCLFDTQGTLCMEGTPGPVPTGYWYWVTGGSEISGSWDSEGFLVASGVDQEKERIGAGWRCHRWSLLDNPHLPHAKAELERLRKKRNWTIDNPTYVREYLGRWAKDEGVLFYKYNEGRNSFTLDEVIPWGPGWRHVLGWDLGSKDDMALVAWGWHPDRRELFEAGSWKKPGALAEEVMAQISNWEKLGFNFIAKVADTGGGGKMYVEDVMSRYSQVFEKASKTEKLDHVRMMNDDFVSGYLKVQRGSQYATELAGLPKDPDWDPDSGKSPAEDPRFPNHCCFVAGTRITTRRGLVPIEDVTVADEVLTRQGWKWVVKHALTGAKAVITRLGLTGTPDHPIWTETRGWQRLDSIRDSDVVLYAWNLAQSNGTEALGIATQNQSVAQTESTTNELRQMESLSGSIEQSGSQYMAPSLHGTISITKTKTPSITVSRILSASLEANICQSTGENLGPRMLLRCEQASKKLDSQLLSGTVPKKAESGTDNTLLKLPQHNIEATSNVSNAAPLLVGGASKNSVQINAQCDGTLERDAQAGSTTSNDYALDVKSPLLSTNITNKKTALAPVYALTVADCHEYFANGVLVSNCDAALYSWRKALMYMDFEPKVEAESAEDAVERMDEERLANTVEGAWWDSDFYGETND